MTSVQQAGRYNAGYLMGPVAALLERKQPVPVPAVPVVSAPSLLALNDVEVIV